MKSKVLLLGDSIRMGYQPLVTAALTDLATVTGPTENCEDSANLLAHLDQWIDAPDLIHFNCGLHDIKRDRQTASLQCSLENYKTNLTNICNRLKQTGAHIIWATSTPVIDQWHHDNKDFDRRVEDVRAYNNAAAAIIASFNFPTNDLFDFISAQNLEQLLQFDGVHFNDTGKQLLADQVTSAIRNSL